MMYADRPIVQAYAELRDVDKVINHLGMSRSRVAEVVVNVCGINHNAARAILNGAPVPFLAGVATAPPEDPSAPGRKVDRPAGISNREYQILVGLGEGLSRTEIAKNLGLSTYTVDDHAKSALRKLGVTTAIEAIRAAVALGVIEVPAIGMPPEPEQYGLNQGEKDALRLVGAGLTAAAVGDALGVSEGCIRSRLSRAYTKLGANGRREAIDLAREAGLIDTPDAVRDAA